jgi:hypothetical protein
VFWDSRLDSSYRTKIAAVCRALTSLMTERFWGWTENAREVQMDMEEMVGKLRRGEPLYGHSTLDLYQQQVAASQSRWAQLKFRMFSDNSIDADIFPFFNFANHSQHGVDIEKYLKAWPEEEREKILAERQGRIDKFKEAFKQGQEKAEIDFVKGDK